MPPSKSSNSGEVSSNNVLSDILENTKEFHFNDIVPLSVPISTGSLKLDNLVTIRSGNVVRLAGSGPETGKTSSSFVLAANYMKTMPKSKTLYFKAEGRLSPEIQARSGMTFVRDPANWEYGTVFVYATNIFEIIAHTIETITQKMHSAGENLCVIIDSLDGVILKSDKEKNLWEGESHKIAGVPYLMKRLFQRSGLLISSYDVLLIVLTQYSASISIDPYSRTPTPSISGSGGSSIAHQSDTVLYYRGKNDSDLILENPDEKPDILKNKILGHFATVEIRKSSTDNSLIRVRIPIKKGRVGCAVWVEREIVDMLVAFGLVTQKTSWFNFDEKMIVEAAQKDGVQIPSKIQGLNALYDFVEKHENVKNWLLELIKKAVMTK